ncbi:Dicarboxylate carrier protein MatC N-terminus [Modestobacter sp. DSM 44400]|uniref:SLC13 family permease n=1 Tax=Modestobacter sp. DSM 44400 TaxID=1550230 RepID=UPI0008968C8C|nr:SLC13 family permease [Modestobacter sp. DSM 44400]SDY25475.1 Dicarboxylate carrier protein MatC N-terminus [Modestobacter sp. DSM 44400]
MSVQLVTILILLAVFLIATVLPVHMGALALTATFIAAYFIYGSEDYSDSVFGFFPGSLFVVLVGVTYLFAIAKNNGTVDWLVHAAVKASGGRLVAIPWAMFTVTAALTAIGGVVPAVVAIIAPVGMSFARRYNINPVLMGLFIINGATAGGFSPISIFGVITNTVVADNDLPGSPLFLWGASIVINVLLSIVVFFLFGGRKLLGGGRVDMTGDHDDDFMAATVAGDATEGTGEDIPGGSRAQGFALGSTGTEGAALSGGRVTPAGHGQPSHQHSTAEDRADQQALQTTALATEQHAAPVTTLDRDRTLTLVGLAVLVIGSLPPFDLDIGLMAITVGVVLSLIAPRGAKGAVGQIAWPTVLLICGIVTFVGLMQDQDTPGWLGDNVAKLGVPLIAALLICYIGAVVSAFASTTGILGALIPLAVPFLLGANAVGAIGLITALALSSSIVDSSPFSTSGALVVANATERERDSVFRTLMIWGFSMVAIIPIVTWLVLVAPGWL